MDEYEFGDIGSSHEDSMSMSAKNYQKEHFYISCGKLNKYYIIPFICPVICMGAHYILGLINRELKDKQLLLILFREITYVITGFLYFVSVFQQKVEKGKQSFDNERKTILKSSHLGTLSVNSINVKEKKSILKKWLLIILVSLLLIVYEAIPLFNIDKHIFDERFFILICIPLLSKLILKENIFRHHYFALTISFTGMIVLFIPVALVVNRDDIVANILKCIFSIGYSLFLIIIKYITNVYYISIFKICLIFSIMSICFTIIGFCIYSLIDYKDFTYIKNNFDFSEVENGTKIIIYFVATFILSIIVDFLLLIIILYFSPILFMVTDIIHPLSMFIVNSIANGVSMPNVILYPIGYLIVLLGSLIYNEVLILNFCGLNKNTKKFVLIRQESESADLKILELEDKDDTKNFFHEYDSSETSSEKL